VLAARSPGRGDRRRRAVQHLAGGIGQHDPVTQPGQPDGQVPGAPRVQDAQPAARAEEPCPGPVAPAIVGLVLDPEFILDAEGRRKLADRFGSAGDAWTQELPGLVERCCSRWNLTLDQAVSGGTARVFLGHQPGGRRLVLKLTPDSGIPADEATALRAWAAARQVVDLLEADPAAGALLLEAVQPGTKVSDWPALPPLADVAGLLTALRQAPGSSAGRPGVPASAARPGVPAGAGSRAAAGAALRPAAGAALRPADDTGSLPAAADGLEIMFDRIERYRLSPPVAALVPAALVDRARRAARALAQSGPAALVHGDLHPANVLDGGPARGLVAIDPRPSLGDPDWDAVDWVMTRAASRTEMQDRIAQLARLVSGLDGDRVWRWCLAAAVVLAVLRLRQHPPNEATGLLLDLAAGSA
jgi:streptomycin 6-kinase